MDYINKPLPKHGYIAAAKAGQIFDRSINLSIIIMLLIGVPCLIIVNIDLSESIKHIARIFGTFGVILTGIVWMIYMRLRVGRKEVIDDN